MCDPFATEVYMSCPKDPNVVAFVASIVITLVVIKIGRQFYQ